MRSVSVRWPSGVREPRWCCGPHARLVEAAQVDATPVPTLSARSLATARPTEPVMSSKSSAPKSAAPKAPKVIVQCKVPGCFKEHAAKGLCAGHRYRAVQLGVYDQASWGASPLFYIKLERLWAEREERLAEEARAGAAPEALPEARKMDVAVGPLKAPAPETPAPVVTVEPPATAPSPDQSEGWMSQARWRVTHTAGGVWAARPDWMTDTEGSYATFNEAAVVANRMNNDERATREADGKRMSEGRNARIAELERELSASASALARADEALADLHRRNALLGEALHVAKAVAVTEAELRRRVALLDIAAEKRREAARASEEAERLTVEALGAGPGEE